jgi:hypothetical protein
MFSLEAIPWKAQNVGGRTQRALHEYLPSGKKITPMDRPILWRLSDSVVGPRFDAQGNIYVAENIRPKRWLFPHEVETVLKAGNIPLTGSGGSKAGTAGQWVADPVYALMASYGSIVKFTPKGGMIQGEGDRGPFGSGGKPFVGEPKLDPALKTVEVSHMGGTYYWDKTMVTGAEWIHPGVSHVGNFGCNCENITFDVDEFGRTFYPDPVLCRVCVIDTAGNDITHFGDYGTENYCGPESPVVDPQTKCIRLRRADDPVGLKSPFATPDIAFSWLVGVGVTDNYVYMGDSMNMRLLRAKLVYAVQETCEIK